MVVDVEPYEEAKIRLLNATHSCLAWGGTLFGTRYIHESVALPTVYHWAHDYATEAAIPCLGTLENPNPLDLPGYRDTVLERFGNAAIADTNQRVAMDGFAKLPGFIVPTVRDCLAAGRSLAAVAMLPALFLAFLKRWNAGTLPFHYEDQAMNPSEAAAICRAADPVAAFCANRVLWNELAGNASLEAALREASFRAGTALPA
jgi:D-arabinitol 4-dehydrogenase